MGEVSLVLGGNFNEVMEPNDRNGGGALSRNLVAFVDFMDEHTLRELPISETKYTWSNMQEVPCLNKLYHFFLSTEWGSSFPSSKGESSPRPTSDHILILLNGKCVMTDPRPFKFENT